MSVENLATSFLRPWVEARALRRADHSFLRALFVPAYYARKAGFSAKTAADELWDHFLGPGLRQDISPSPLFQPEVLDRGQGSAAERLIRSSLLWWSNRKTYPAVVPTHRFDAEYYLRSYSDVRDAGISPYEHFIRFGLAEGRRPNAVFDPIWYDGHATREPGEEALPSYLHYLVFGAARGLPPARGLTFNFADSAKSVDGDALAHYDLYAGKLDLHFLRALFCPAYYAAQAGISDVEKDEDLFGHFLSTGLRQGLSPSPLFQPEYVVRSEDLGTGEDHAQPALVRWWLNRGKGRPVPTARFDADFYAHTYPDVGAAGMDAFEHFIYFGLSENRRPNAVFDAHWYQEVAPRNATEESLPAYLHYLTFGAARGAAPNRHLVPVFAHQAKVPIDGLLRYDLVVNVIRPWAKLVGSEHITVLLALFLSYSYSGGGELTEDADGVERLSHFLQRGLAKGLDPGPLFDSDYYFSLRGADQTSVESAGQVALIHFLEHGIGARTVPNKLFDESAYRLAQPDVATADVWGFQHFILHGIFEGRAIDRRAPTVNATGSSSTERALHNWQMFWADLSDSVPQSHSVQEIRTVRRRLQSIFESAKFQEIISRARALDPTLGDTRTITSIFAPPSHDPAEDLRIRLRARFPRNQYDTIIFVPWLRNGGADLVACLLAETLRSVRTGESVLLLRVDYNNFERPDWIPAGVDCVHVSDILSAGAQEQAERLLYSVVLGLNPKRVINVNSYLGWRMFERFGRRLSRQTLLYAYLFLWDQTPEGLRVGYPSEFFPTTCDFLQAIFTDTDFLRSELIKLYHPPLAVRNRIVPLFSPARCVGTTRVLAGSGAQAREGMRPRVLWAGRLDRQKRFDLVQEIAHRMPHVDFDCWGAPLLDQGPDLTRSPGNLALHEPFQDYDELPFEDSNLWLFTSAWEGMPTILIEVAIRGVAVVASSVGGVPELIDDSTGYPVAAGLGADAYVRTIQQALDDPNERLTRAERLQRRALSRYTRAGYSEQIGAVLSREH